MAIIRTTLKDTGFGVPIKFTFLKKKMQAFHNKSADIFHLTVHEQYHIYRYGYNNILLLPLQVLSYEMLAFFFSI